jgi:hypothetical protein
MAASVIDLTQYPVATGQQQGLSIPDGCYIHSYEQGVVTLRCAVSPPPSTGIPDVPTREFKPRHRLAEAIGAIIVTVFVVLIFVGLVAVIARAVRGRTPDGPQRKELVAVAVVPQERPGDGTPPRVYYIDDRSAGGGGSGAGWALFAVVLILIFLLPTLSVSYRDK